MSDTGEPHQQGQHFQAQRKALGLTREELARRCGVSVRTIVRYELHGSTPAISTLRRLSLAVGIPIDQMIPDDDELAEGQAG